MVPMRNLERAYQQLRNCKVYISDYRDSEAYDVVFSMTTADTFLAGIADTVLAGQAVPFEHLPILVRENLRSNTSWLMENGEGFDLSSFPELLNWAKIIETVRRECLKRI
jgi:hypothetical protein